MPVVFWSNYQIISHTFCIYLYKGLYISTYTRLYIYKVPILDYTYIRYLHYIRYQYWIIYIRYLPILYIKGTYIIYIRYHIIYIYIRYLYWIIYILYIYKVPILV